MTGVLLWLGLALALVVAGATVRVMARAQASGRLSLWGRSFADKATDPAGFSAVFPAGLLLGGLAVAAALALAVELFLVR